jgi:hypothetical protein
MSDLCYAEPDTDRHSRLPRHCIYTALPTVGPLAIQDDRRLPRMDVLPPGERLGRVYAIHVAERREPRAITAIRRDRRAYMVERGVHDARGARTGVEAHACGD